MTSPRAKQRRTVKPISFPAGTVRTFKNSPAGTFEYWTPRSPWYSTALFFADEYWDVESSSWKRFDFGDKS